MNVSVGSQTVLGYTQRERPLLDPEADPAPALRRSAFTKSSDAVPCASSLQPATPDRRRGIVPESPCQPAPLSTNHGIVSYGWTDAVRAGTETKRSDQRGE